MCSAFFTIRCIKKLSGEELKYWRVNNVGYNEAPCRESIDLIIIPTIESLPP